MSELSRQSPAPPLDFALTCTPDEFAAAGFDYADIRRLFLWLDGGAGFVSDQELRRFQRLQQLVTRLPTS